MFIVDATTKKNTRRFSTLCLTGADDSNSFPYQRATERFSFILTWFYIFMAKIETKMLVQTNKKKKQKLFGGWEIRMIRMIPAKHKT